MTKALNHHIQAEAVYVLINMLLEIHEIPLFCHLMLGNKEGYIIYIQPPIPLLFAQRSCF